MHHALLDRSTEPRIAAHASWSGSKLQVFVGIHLAIAFAAGECLWRSPHFNLTIIAAVTLMLAIRAIAGIFRRARDVGPVVTINEVGIFDRRIMRRPIFWWEIDYVFPINIDQGRVLEFRLRYGDTSWSGRGRLLKAVDRALRRLHYPDVCINFLLLDGTMSEIWRAIASHRPDLLPVEQRRAERGLV